jgi:integrase
MRSASLRRSASTALATALSCRPLRESIRDLVFANQTGGALDLRNAAARHFKPLLKAYYPLPNIRVYDLRHTHVTHLLAAGTPVHVVAKRAGHASAKMTLDVYGHVLAGQDGDAVAKLEAYWAAGV